MAQEEVVVQKILEKHPQVDLIFGTGQEYWIASRFANVGTNATFGIYTVKGDEFFLDGHFPGFPIVPGVILCEILAQSTAILLKDKMQEGKVCLYTGLDKVRFKSPVLPGDRFETKCRIVRSKGIFYFAEGEGYVGEELKIKAEYSFALADKSALCSQKS